MLESLNKVVGHQPVDVFFAGFSSDTMTLQRNGWQLAFQNDTYNHHIRLAGTHPAGQVNFITNGLDKREFCKYDVGEVLHNVQFRVCHVFNEGRILVMPAPSVGAWNSFDAFSPATSSIEEVGFHDWVPFKSTEAAKEIVVPKHSVTELLELALERQDERLVDVRKRQKARKRDADCLATVTDIDIQIVSA